MRKDLQIKLLFYKKVKDRCRIKKKLNKVNKKKQYPKQLNQNKGRYVVMILIGGHQG